MEELCACKKGFQTASGIFAQVMATQGLILTACILIGTAILG